MSCLLDVFLTAYLGVFSVPHYTENKMYLTNTAAISYQLPHFSLIYKGNTRDINILKATNIDIFSPHGIKFSHTCMCYTSSDNIISIAFLVDDSLNNSINPKKFSENMFYQNSLKSVNFIYKGCQRMHRCFSLSLFLVTLTNAESWRNGVLNSKRRRRRRKETVSNVLWPTHLNISRQYPPLSIFTCGIHSTSVYSFLSNERYSHLTVYQKQCE